MKATLNCFAVKEGHCPYNLGTQSISRYCNQRGHSVEMSSIKPEDTEEAVERILSSDSEVIGFSSNHFTEPQVSEMIKRIKYEN